MAWKIVSVVLGVSALVLGCVWFVLLCIMIFGVLTPEGSIDQVLDGICWTLACGAIGIPLATLSLKAWERGA